MKPKVVFLVFEHDSTARYPVTQVGDEFSSLKEAKAYAQGRYRDKNLTWQKSFDNVVANNGDEIVCSITKKES